MVSAPVGLTTASSTALALALVQLQAIGAAASIETAVSLGVAHGVIPANDNSLALALSAPLSVGVAVETDLALSRRGFVPMPTPPGRIIANDPTARTAAGHLDNRRIAPNLQPRRARR
jgi:hypothetical protein